MTEVVIEVDLRKVDKKKVETLKAMLDAASPRSTVDRLSEALKAYPDEGEKELGFFKLSQAAKLLNEEGNVPPEHLEKYMRLFGEVQGILFRPIAKRDAARQEGCASGGRESGASRRENERRELVLERARALLKQGTPRREIAEILAEHYEYSARHIRTILKQKKFKPTQRIVEVK